MEINPDKITDYTRTDDELLCYFLFTVAVAGKTAKTVAPKVNDFLDNPTNYILIKSGIEGSTFEFEDTLTLLENGLKDVKMGKYNTFRGLFTSLFTKFQNYHTFISFLRNAKPQDLEELHGVGQKTSRFFILHSRKDVGDIAVLDTHILKFLRLFYDDAPKSTPSNAKTYAVWESRFVELYRTFMHTAKISLADFDLGLWVYYSHGFHKSDTTKAKTLENINTLFTEGNLSEFRRG